MRSPNENRGEKNGRGKTAAILGLVAGGALAVYPLLMYWSRAGLGARWMASILVALCVFRLVAMLSGRSVPVAGAFGAPLLLAICIGSMALALVSVWRESAQAMLYYPVLVNAVLLAAFGWSVLYPPTIVERVARATRGDLPDEAMPYLRRVTIAWILFFVCNGTVAFVTATETSFQTWAFYNGFVAYLLIGAMFGGEFLVRLRVMRNLRK